MYNGVGWLFGTVFRVLKLVINAHEGITWDIL